MRRGVEARRFPRKLVLLRGVIADREGTHEMPCVIRDASRSGCRIICEALHSISDDITLKPERMKAAIPGRIMWRNGKMAGVQLDFPKRPDPGATKAARARASASSELCPV